MPADADGPTGAAPDLRTALRQLGVAEEAIARAGDDATLRLLALDRLILVGDARYDEEEVAARTGVPTDLARRFWRALGFTDVAPDEPAFSDADVDALATVASMMERGVVEPDMALQTARIVASSMARVADAYLARVRSSAAGRSDPQSLVFDIEALEQTPRLLEYVWRRHLQVAARRELMAEITGEGTGSLAVGFADLVGFTALSQQLDDADLAALVERFVSVAHDGVVSGGGRVVKIIGDEVMFVVDHPRAGVEIALTLADAYAGDVELSDVRVGLACGDVVRQEADYYGPVVNLASRIVGLARPGTVLVSETVRETLADDPSLAWRPLRPRNLKGIGRVRLWVCRRA